MTVGNVFHSKTSSFRLEKFLDIWSGILRLLNLSLSYLEMLCIEYVGVTIMTFENLVLL